MWLPWLDDDKKKLKLHWLKRPKGVTNKRNLGSKINDSKPHVWSLSFSFRISSRKSQIIHFTIQFHSKHLTRFTK